MHGTSAGREIAALFRARSAGVLLHLSSLPSPHGIGDLGAKARAFVEWLERAGLRWWQMLPVGPIGRGDSPYSSASAFAGEELFLDLEQLVREGLLGRREIEAPSRLRRGPVDYEAARRFKRPLLRLAWRRFARAGGERDGEQRDFVARNASWLADYARLSPGDPDYHCFVQQRFERQWRALREHARSRGVLMLGDLPIFVVASSVDVRAHPRLFRLDARGRPTVVTGVPPDLYAQNGQLWGHPHYDWPAHRRTRFRWWIERFERGLARFDALRVDHFIGFHRAWEIPAGARNARRGAWGPAPGRELLGALGARIGALPLVAEDLGLVTDEVHALREEFRLPGMRVLQFGFGADGYHRPHNFPQHSVCYTGTHDNDTARGWWRTLAREERARLREYAGASGANASWELVRLAFASPARIAIAPVQDLLGLGGAARMNRPGVARGNWRWRLGAGALDPALARRVRRLAQACERA